MEEPCVELAAVNVTDSTHAPMATLVNPGRGSIPRNVVALTGITNSMVSAPAVPSFARAAELLEEFVDAAGAVYSHTTRFRST